MSRGEPLSTAGSASNCSSDSVGRVPASHRQVGSPGVVRRHRGDRQIQLEIGKSVTGGGADELDAFGERVADPAVVGTGQADHVGMLGGHRQQSISVAGDQDRHIG